VNVPDKAFSSKIMGDGIAFKFTGDSIYAPCNAKVVMMPKTKHAIGLNVDGIEILIHIGLDTVSLNGKGFTSYTVLGNTVKRGDLLLKIDREVMKEAKIDMTSVMIITSTDTKLIISNPSKVDLDSVVIRIV
jgi:glucose-specific phosphotransferase system IIA component